MCIVFSIFTRNYVAHVDTVFMYSLCNMEDFKKYIIDQRQRVSFFWKYLVLSDWLFTTQCHVAKIIYCFTFISLWLLSKIGAGILVQFIFYAKAHLRVSYTLFCFDDVVHFIWICHCLLVLCDVSRQWLTLMRWSPRFRPVAANISLSL